VVAESLNRGEDTGIIMDDNPSLLSPPLPAPAPEAPGPTSRGSRMGGWIAVMVIAVSVAVAMGRVAGDKAAMTTGEESATAQIQAEIGARYLVGMNDLLGPLLESAGHSKQAWLAPLEAAAQSSRQRLELEIVRREVFGPSVTGEPVAIPEPVTADERRDWETWRALMAEGGTSGEGAAISAEERARFDDRYGWFARLAASQGRPAGDEARDAVLAQARRTFVGSLVLMTGVVIAFAGGCALAVWAAIRFLSGRGDWRYARVEGAVVAATGGSVWLETFAVYLGFMVLGGVAADVLPQAWAPWPQAAAMLGAAGFGLFWPAFRGLGRAERRAGFGLTRGRGIWRELGAGVIGYCAGLPIVAVGVGITMALTVAFKADASHPLNHLTGVAPPVLVFLGLLAAVWAPVVEELFFRGAFFAAWRQRFGRWVSGLATGILFAAVHPQGWTAIPALGAVGLVFALLREWRGSIIAPMAAHALNNGTLFVMMVVVMR
jgi:membrane protease YdiL (CAAX protease family)